MKSGARVVAQSFDSARAAQAAEFGEGPVFIALTRKADVNRCAERVSACSSADIFVVRLGPPPIVNQSHADALRLQFFNNLDGVDRIPPRRFRRVNELMNLIRAVGARECGFAFGIGPDDLLAPGAAVRGACTGVEELLFFRIAQIHLRDLSGGRFFATGLHGFFGIVILKMIIFLHIGSIGTAVCGATGQSHHDKSEDKMSHFLILRIRECFFESRSRSPFVGPALDWTNLPSDNFVYEENPITTDRYSH